MAYVFKNYRNRLNLDYDRCGDKGKWNWCNALHFFPKETYIKRHLSVQIQSIHIERWTCFNVNNHWKPFPLFMSTIRSIIHVKQLIFKIRSESLTLKISFEWIIYPMLTWLDSGFNFSLVKKTTLYLSKKLFCFSGIFIAIWKKNNVGVILGRYYYVWW